MKEIIKYELQQKMALPLDMKIELTMHKIKAWYDHFDGKVYISFSGGKDSTVLLHIARSVYPDIKAVFCNTGLEYPEIVSFVKTFDNVDIIRPKKNFKQVITEYGFPVVSKTVSMGVSRYRNTKSELQKELRKNGGINPTSGKRQHPSIPMKWHKLINAPFKISEKCCDLLKKEPFAKYEKGTGFKSIIGLIYDEGYNRNLSILNNGCVINNEKKNQLRPLIFWNNKDIDTYIENKNIKLSDIYKTEKRTGCMFCMFGAHMENGENRFQRMRNTHPKLYDYCINKLDLKTPLSYMGVDY